MKTLGRILIILAVFGLVMGVTYGIVNARSTSGPGGTPSFGRDNGRLVPPDGAPQNFASGTRPEFPGRERDGFRGGRDGGGMLFGAIRNIAIIGIIVALIAVPKSWMQKRRRAAQSAVG